MALTGKAWELWVQFSPQGLDFENFCLRDPSPNLYKDLCKDMPKRPEPQLL